MAAGWCTLRRSLSWPVGKPPQPQTASILRLHLLYSGILRDEPDAVRAIESWISTCLAPGIRCMCIVRPSGDILATTGSLRDACWWRYRGGKATITEGLTIIPLLSRLACACTVRACMTDTETTRQHIAHEFERNNAHVRPLDEGGGADTPSPVTSLKSIEKTSFFKQEGWESNISRRSAFASEDAW